MLSGFYRGFKVHKPNCYSYRDDGYCEGKKIGEKSFDAICENCYWLNPYGKGYFTKLKKLKDAKNAIQELINMLESS